MKLALVVTNLGDLFVAGMVALAVGFWIWRKLDGMTAVVFCLCFGGVLAAATALKLVTRYYFYDPAVSGLFDLSSGAPSGHSALAAVLYGSLLAVFVQAGRGLARIFGALLSLAAIVVVAVTRVTLHTHTAADVLTGLAVAVLGVALFTAVLFARRFPPTETWSLLVLTVAVGLIALVSGIQVSSAQLL